MRTFITPQIAVKPVNPHEWSELASGWVIQGLERFPIIISVTAYDWAPYCVTGQFEGGVYGRLIDYHGNLRETTLLALRTLRKVEEFESEANDVAWIVSQRILSKPLIIPNGEIQLEPPRAVTVITKQRRLHGILESITEKSMKITRISRIGMELGTVRIRLEQILGFVIESRQLDLIVENHKLQLSRAGHLPKPQGEVGEMIEDPRNLDVM